MTTTTPQATPDFAAIKQRQQATWASGDYAAVGTMLQIVGETLCEAVDLRAGQRVLDVAAGNGNATLAAARRFCDVTSTDYVGALLDKGAARAGAEGLRVKFETADVEALPYADGSFDAVLSTFGVMFAPDHATSAHQMLRVLRPGGRIGLANWTPEGFIGRLFKTVGQHVAPPAGVQPPALWGREAHLRSLFGDDAAEIRCERRHFVFRARSAAHWIDFFRQHYGPTLKAFAALDPTGRQALEGDLAALIDEMNTGGATSMRVPSEYLEVVVTKRGQA